MNIKRYFLVTSVLLLIFVELSDQGRERRVRRRRRRRKKTAKANANSGRRNFESPIRDDKKRNAMAEMRRKGMLWHRSASIQTEKPTEPEKFIEPDLTFHLPEQFCSCARSKPEYHEDWELKHRNRRKRHVRVRRSVSASGRDRIVGGYNAAHNKVLL